VDKSLFSKLSKFLQTKFAAFARLTEGKFLHEERTMKIKIKLSTIQVIRTRRHATSE